MKNPRNTISIVMSACACIAMLGLLTGCGSSEPPTPNTALSKADEQPKTTTGPVETKKGAAEAQTGTQSQTGF